MKKYQPVIGLEIHVELITNSKMFCNCSSDYFDKEPNTLLCPVCLGLPGALPVPNKKAIEWTILIGQALNCQINKEFKFDRKHYFYPDLPKGYQISQYDKPIASKGMVKLKTNNQKEKQKTKMFKITRVHLEEDTGKLVHKGKETLIDFNRSGVPLVEIVTEPVFDNSDDVKLFLKELQIIIRYLGVSDADMEKGSMRLEPNISVKKIKQKGLPSYKVEVKNINSFKFVKRAIDYELKRQIKILENGKIPDQETRGFDDQRGETYSQRVKEDAHDYRYFPEPDIPPFKYSDGQLKKIFKNMPELPIEKLERFVSKYKIKESDAFILTRDRKLADYFEKVNLKFRSKNLSQKIANLIVNKKISTKLPINKFVDLVKQNLIKKSVDNKVLKKVIKMVVDGNPKPVEDYKKGKKNALMFLVGQVMKEMKGQVEAKEVIENFKKKLG